MLLGTSFHDRGSKRPDSLLRGDPDVTVSCLEIQLLQYSTRKPHPDAMSSTLQTCHTLVQDDLYPDLMISGDFLVIALRNPANVGLIIIQFWHWRTGEMFFSTENDCGAVIFLSKDLFLIPSSKPSISQMFIYRIIADESDPLRTPEVRPIMSLLLPIRSGEILHQLLECRSHPRRHAPFNTTLASANKHAFYEDPSRSIIRITIKALLFDASLTMAMIVFHQKTILNLVSAHESRPDVPQLAWEMWGPQSTRVFRSDLWLNWYPTSLSGSRLAYLEPKSSPSSNGGLGPRMLHVLDFDPLRARRMISLVGSGDAVGTGYEKEFGVSLQKAHIEVVNEKSPTIILASEPGPFGQDVTTYLPHIRSTLLSSGDKSAFTAPRMRDRVSNWMNNQLLMASRKRAWMRQAHCRWDSVLMDSNSLVGLKVCAPITLRGTC